LVELGEAENDEATIAEAERELSNLAKFARQQKVECLFSGEVDGNDCFLEIHAGAGGTESHDWAEMLFRMYCRWAERHNYKIELIDKFIGEEAGIKSATIKILGLNAYGWLKTESGVHRLVRISPFNAAGKRHTSFASVWVYPVIDDAIDIEINESELRIDTYRSSGAGGQHVNTTDSAVRITHIPTNIVVQCQNNRSQHRNKEECYRMLRSRLYEEEMKKRLAAANATNASKTDIGWGNQIRSYVLHPYQMVKDTRTAHEDTDSAGVLDGKLDDFMRAMLEQMSQGKGMKV
jgi:peptide chain release factor 2